MLKMRFVENDCSGAERVIPDNLDKIRQILSSIKSVPMMWPPYTCRPVI